MVSADLTPEDRLMGRYFVSESLFNAQFPYGVTLPKSSEYHARVSASTCLASKVTLFRS
jgi:hypothetical protein